MPTAVADRLEPLNIDFRELPGLVQRAVLWDSGFAISPGNDPVQIWTLYKHSMADLALPISDVRTVDCTMINCSQPNNVTAYYTHSCSSSQILNMVRCVVDTFEDPGAATYLGSFWSVGGDPSSMPELEVREHLWTEATGEGKLVKNSLYAVHTIPSTDDVAWGACPLDNEYASLTIPCRRRDDYPGDLAGLGIPKGSSWVTKWLEEEFGHAFPVSLVVAGVAVLIAAIALGGFRWRRRAQRAKQLSSALNEAMPRPPNVSSDGAYEAAGTSKTLQLLLESEHLRGKRIPFESLVFEKTLSKGAFGEVWVCKYNQHKVTVKRVLQTKQQKAEKFKRLRRKLS